MKTKVKVKMKPVNTILTRLGVTPDGDVQMFATNSINRRITRYMPYRSSALATKLKYIKSPTQIEVAAPYARYQYHGKVMVGKAPKTVTSRDLKYDTTKHTLAGPFWDRRLMAAEGGQIAAEVQKYVDRKRRG